MSQETDTYVFRSIDLRYLLQELARLRMPWLIIMRLGQHSAELDLHSAVRIGREL